jgi:hypothetical protein
MDREEMEAAIVRNAVYELLDHGFLLCVDNGGDEYEISRSSDGEAVLAEMMATDEERLIAIRADKMFGWVYFVYGNDGHDVICDMTVSLEPYLSETTALAETLAE